MDFLCNVILSLTWYHLSVCKFLHWVCIRDNQKVVNRVYDSVVV